MDKPTPGETTDDQQQPFGGCLIGRGRSERELTLGNGFVYGTGNRLPGFNLPLRLNYQLIRCIIRQPTVALTASVYTGPVMMNTWVTKRRSDATDEMSDWITAQFMPMRSGFIQEALRSIWFGWRPFEKVWENIDGIWTVVKLKGLLPELTTILTDKHGGFEGLQQADIVLKPVQCMVITSDMEAGNLHGTSRCDNIVDAWYKWLQTDERAAQLTTKVASIIPLIHYPTGVSQDENGKDVNNYVLAQKMMNLLSTAIGIGLPNEFAASDDPEVRMKLAGSSQWVISFLEASTAAPALAGMTDRMRYYDACMIRGCLLPERAVIEATTAGSRADSETQGDAAVLGAMQVGQEIAKQFSRYCIDDALELRYGPKARGAIWFEDRPLTDEAREFFAQIFDAILTNPQALVKLLKQIDVDAVISALQIPKAQDTKVIKLDDLTDPSVPPPQGPAVEAAIRGLKDG